MAGLKSKSAEMQAPVDPVSVLLEEYRALYGLLALRVQAIERRVPLIGASLAGIVATLSSVEPRATAFLLWAIPVALVWFTRTTISHVRSLEDLLRRIEEIERVVNGRAGEDLLVFQSSHPSRGVFVGGRTGGESILAVLLWSGLLLVGIAYLAGDAIERVEWFVAYLGLVGLYLIVMVSRYARYRYERDAGGQTS